MHKCTRKVLKKTFLYLSFLSCHLSVCISNKQIPNLDPINWKCLLICLWWKLTDRWGWTLSWWLPVSVSLTHSYWWKEAKLNDINRIYLIDKYINILWCSVLYCSSYARPKIFVCQTDRDKSYIINMWVGEIGAPAV